MHSEELPISLETSNLRLPPKALLGRPVDLGSEDIPEGPGHVERHAGQRLIAIYVSIELQQELLRVGDNDFLTPGPHLLLHLLPVLPELEQPLDEPIVLLLSPLAGVELHRTVAQGHGL